MNSVLFFMYIFWGLCFFYLYLIAHSKQRETEKGGNKEPLTWASHSTCCAACHPTKDYY